MIFFVHKDVLLVRAVLIYLAALAGLACLSYVLRLRIFWCTIKRTNRIFFDYFVVLIVCCVVNVFLVVARLIYRKSFCCVRGSCPLQDDLRGFRIIRGAVCKLILRAYAVLIIIVFPGFAHQNVRGERLVVHGQGLRVFIPVCVCCWRCIFAEQHIVELLPPFCCMVIIYIFQLNRFKFFVNDKGVDLGICCISVRGLCFLYVVCTRLLEFHHSKALSVRVNHVGFHVALLDLEICFLRLRISQGVCVCVITVFGEGVVFCFRLTLFRTLHVFQTAMGVYRLVLDFYIVVIKGFFAGNGVTVYSELSAFKKDIGCLRIPLGDGYR